MHILHVFILFLVSVADNNFPLFNEEKPTYTDQKFELGTNDQSVFKLCPAVTTILGESKSAASKFILERWKNNLIAELGVDGFENYQKSWTIFIFLLDLFFIFSTKFSLYAYGSRFIWDWRNIS